MPRERSSRRFRPTRRVFSRSGEWPPDATGCDLIVNATPVRDELLVEPAEGQTVVDLAYGPEETALVAAARAAGCVVVDGLEALVRQGAASFRLWTGLEPPVEVMRARGQALDQTTVPTASTATMPAATSAVRSQSRPWCSTTGSTAGVGRAAVR